MSRILWQYHYNTLTSWRLLRDRGYVVNKDVYSELLHYGMKFIGEVYHPIVV